MVTNAHNATSRRLGSGTEQQVVLSNGRAEISWGFGAELTCFEHAGMNTLLLGGPLIELLDAAHGQRPFTVGMGRDSDEDFATDPQPIQDALGSGLRARRVFPVAGQHLIAELDITIHDAHPGVLLSLRVANHGPEPLTINRLFPFVAGRAWGEQPIVLGGREHEFAVYKQGWQSWSFAGGLPPATPDPRPQLRTASLWHNPSGPAPNEPLGAPADVVSDGMALVGHDDSYPALLVGFLGAERYFGQVYVDRHNASISTASLLEGRVLVPGEVVESEPVLLAVGQPNALLDTYADALARRQGARPSAAAPTGWCSWYYYFTTVTERDVLENLSALRAARAMLPLEVMQIDDGYQTAVGDWTTPNQNFPGGMAALAGRIRDAGFRPGLWLAPFTAAAGSRLAAEHPEWLVHDDRGQPRDAGENWHTTLYGLDTTHPGAREWLRRLFSTIVEQWGFDYLKLDFLVTGAVSGQRWMPSATRAGALRHGLELIRSIVGDQVYLLACGCPLLSAAGLVDAMRIGPDVAPFWSHASGRAPLPPGDAQPQPNAEGALRNTLVRAWMHPTLWANDPDCLLARDADTELTLDEIRALATAIGLTGGMVVISDAMAHLTLERIQLAATLLPPLRERARPLSYFAAGVPERVLTHVVRPWGSWWLVGVFNGDGLPREMRVTWRELGLEPGPYHAAEFWSGSYLGISDDGAAVSLGAHGAAVLAVRTVASNPLLLSTSFHLSQGGVEIASWDYEHDSGRLRWVAALGRHAYGTFTLWMPSELTPRRLVSTARYAHWRHQEGNQSVIIVEAEIADRAEFALEMERTG